jgi:hypothetical protein
VHRLRPAPKLGTGHERLQWLLGEIGDHTRGSDLCTLEGPSYGSPNKQHAMGGLWWMVAHGLWRRGIPYAVVTPDQLKIYACGTSRKDKDEVLAAVIRRYQGVEVNGNDEADALVLAAMAAHYLGSPLAPVPATHLRALTMVKWPERFQDLREELTGGKADQAG